jgi:hypothetical protein
MNAMKRHGMVRETYRRCAVQRHPPPLATRRRKVIQFRMTEAPRNWLRLSRRTTAVTFENVAEGKAQRGSKITTGPDPSAFITAVQRARRS